MSALTSVIEQARQQAVHTPASHKTLISCMDLTNLDLTATPEQIQLLCEEAKIYEVAAVCLYPEYIAQAKKNLPGAIGVKVATVSNFPSGEASLDQVCSDIENALALGADEIDVVIPYQLFLQKKDRAFVKSFVHACKNLLPHQTLKVILESGAFEDSALLSEVAFAALEGGADFLKTSTGKIANGADMGSAAVILQAIQNFGDEERGFKVSGGVRTAIQAQEYFALTQLMLAKKELTKNHFRLGASSLLSVLVGT